MKAVLLSCIVLVATSAMAEDYKIEKIGGLDVIVWNANSPSNPNAIEATQAEIEASLDVQFTPSQLALSGLTSEEQAYMEETPFSMIQNASSGYVNAVLDKVDGKYMLQVETENGSYNCLASPGKPSKSGGVATPHFNQKQPYKVEKVHYVSAAKSYAGAKMPWPVWISGGFAIHGGDGGGPVVTGKRESHGCIRVACAQKFNAEVKRVGLANTRITVRTN